MRRTACGDLTSVFRPHTGEPTALPDFVAKDAFIEGIHKAKFKEAPVNFHPLSPDESAHINQHPDASTLMPRQEKGIRPACALPYQLMVDGIWQADRHQFSITFAARTERFGRLSAGAPFIVYNMADHSVRNYAVSPVII